MYPKSLYPMLNESSFSAKEKRNIPWEVRRCIFENMKNQTGILKLPNRNSTLYHRMFNSCCVIYLFGEGLAPSPRI